MNSEVLFNVAGNRRAINPRKSSAAFGHWNQPANVTICLPLISHHVSHTVDTTPCGESVTVTTITVPCFQLQKLGSLNNSLVSLIQMSLSRNRDRSVQHSPWSFRFVYFSPWPFSAYRQLISLLQWWTSVWTCPQIRDGLLWRTSMTFISWEKLHLMWSSKYR